MTDLLWWLVVVIVVIVAVTLLMVFKGAPYVPTRRRDLKSAFDELYGLNENDTLVDIGSGDGIVLRMASERGARAIGVELNPFLVMLSRFLGRKSDRHQVVLADIWRYSLPPETTIVYVFGTGRDVGRIVKWAEAQVAVRRRPLYVMSYGFKLPWVNERTNGSHFLYRLEPLQGD